jgi:15-cis-phytoene synthase
MIDPATRQIFRRGSRTYYISSAFFPEPIRSDVFTLYAYVRTADDFVDAIPADRAGFATFKQQTWSSWDILDTNATLPDGVPPIVTEFVKLCQRTGIERCWVAAFLASMELDFGKKKYHSIAETCTYMYGSAEVIGLMLAKIFKLPAESYPAARLLGRSMQYINMIRDVGEDLEKLGRHYLPLDETVIYGLPYQTKLSAQVARENPGYVAAYIRAQLGRQQHWMLAAKNGFKFLPRSLRIPVMTATDMYCWTAEQIWNDPTIIWQKQLKPSTARVALTAVGHTITTGFDRV